MIGVGPCSTQDFMEYCSHHHSPKKKSSVLGNPTAAIIAIGIVLLLYSFTLPTGPLHGFYVRNKVECLYLLQVGSFLVIWFLTPVSDWIVDHIIKFLPVQVDIWLGNMAASGHQLLLRREVIHDPYYGNLLQQIGETLKASALKIHPHTNSYQWQFCIINSPEVNAFAFPSGFILVTTGLLETLKPTEGELAALLGHEMGHVLCRHSVRRIVQKLVLRAVLLFFEKVMRRKRKRRTSGSVKAMNFRLRWILQHALATRVFHVGTNTKQTA